MRFWFTTHWPAREDEPAGRTPEGVWVPDGKFAAIRDLAPRDYVWIYEAKRGPTAKHGHGVVKSRPGRMGVVALVEVTDQPMEIPGSVLQEYVGRPGVWWRYHAATRPLNTVGFLAAHEAASLLGHNPRWRFRGLSNGAGVVQISPSQHQRLLQAFVAASDVDLRARLREQPGHGYGGPGGEQEPHRTLKLRVAADPAAVLAEPGLRHVATELRFPTGDSIDVVLEDSLGRLVAVEIEVDCGRDEVCGPLQCMKYRGLVAYRFGRDPAEVRMVLAAYSVAPPVAERCTRYSIEVKVVPK